MNLIDFTEGASTKKCFEYKEANKFVYTIFNNCLDFIATVGSRVVVNHSTCFMLEFHFHIS